jgi:hypothetical protein
LVVIAWSCALLRSGVAHADDEVPALHAKLDADRDGPQLTLDPALRFDPVEGPATYTTDDASSRFVLGPHSHLDVDGRIWRNGISTPGGGSEGGHAGWTAAGHYDVELAWGIHLEVDASLMKLAPQMNGMFGNGMVAGFGAALTRYFKWGHGRTAWISLGVDHEEFVGDRAVGIPHGTTVGLRVGTTF